MVWITLPLILITIVILVALVFKIQAQVNGRLDLMTQAIQEANKVIGQNLGSATQMFGSVQEKLGKLEQTNLQVYAMAKDIVSLQELLRAPKFRGQMGETLLENLLAQVLPKSYYQVQYRFKSSDTVDAVIRLGERLVPIDAKFSLENFQKLQDEKDEQLKNSYRKKFVQDIKNRADEIASKYILPQENTYDFALMYIPAENIYYEVTVKEELLGYFISRKVIPVSPNTLYAYLQVICLGLRGMKIEENAKAILKNLSALSVDINRFRDEFNVLGGHISNASAKYADAQKRLDRFSEKLVTIQEDKAISADS